MTETLAELAREQTGERVLLRGLTEADVARFIEQTRGRLAAGGPGRGVYRETEGNPFFVHEVVRLLASDGRLARRVERRVAGASTIPQGVREVIGRRLNRLSEECNEVLAVASVIGREFSLPMLQQVGGIADEPSLEALEEALAARVIGEVPGAGARPTASPTR